MAKSDDERAYDTAKDALYNIDARPAPVRVLVIAPTSLTATSVERHFRSLITPGLHMVEDDGLRWKFKNGSSVCILERSGATDFALYAEGNSAL